MDLEDGKRMFGDLKSKLGFGPKNQEPEYDDYYDEAYDEYGDDYGDYADDGYEDGYESYAPQSERASSHASSDPYRITSRNRSTTPRLVSMEDVRANARATSGYDRETTSTRQGAYANRAGGFDNGRTMVDSSLPPQMTPEGTAAAAAAATRRRSEGLDSLFSSTVEASEPAQPATSPARSFNSYETHASGYSAGYGASRGVKVVKPASYGDVEGVARALKGGDAVVLALGNTPDALSKRILDFSFGVASALDANVDAIDNKVFAITKGGELTDAERISLRNQGVL